MLVLVGPPPFFLKKIPSPPHPPPLNPPAPPPNTLPLIVVLTLSIMLDVYSSGILKKSENSTLQRWSSLFGNPRAKDMDFRLLAFQIFPVIRWGTRSDPRTPNTSLIQKTLFAPTRDATPPFYIRFWHLPPHPRFVLIKKNFSRTFLGP